MEKIIISPLLMSFGHGYSQNGGREWIAFYRIRFHARFIARYVKRKVGILFLYCDSLMAEEGTGTDLEAER